MRFGRWREGFDQVCSKTGLLAALAALATDFSAHTGAHVRRGFSPGLPALSRQTELVLYRVAQEALTNIARHSGADTVQISLTRQGNAVALVVADNGLGIHGQPEGAGTRGMRERAQLVEGELAIRPGPEGGTEVRLVVPVGTAQ